MRCSVQNCSNDTKRLNKSHGITFHLVPKEPNLRLAWMEALGTPDWVPKERSTICSEHFRNEDFYQTKTGMRKVKNEAVPVIIHESSEDLEAPAALRVCRICLAMDTRLFDIREQNLDQYYLQITGLFVTDEDRFPQRVCWECAQRLRSAAAFRCKALRAHSTLIDTLHEDRYLTIKDVKSINRTHNKLTTTLVQKIYENNDSDLHIRDNEIIKSEANDDDNDDDHEYTDSVNDFDYNEVKEIPDIKDESNEIFVNEYDDFESDDEKTLSALSTKTLSGLSTKTLSGLSTNELSALSTQDEKSKVKERKKKVKVKKVKVMVKKNEPIKRKDEEQNPETTMDKYKTSDIKRRKPNDGLDESLFTITTLTYEEQIAEVEKRQESTAYKNAMFKCTTCYRGFQIRDRYDAHIVRHSEKCGMYECFICKTRLKAARALRKHITAQHTEQFSCKGCPFVTRNRGVAREHEKWHAGTKYQCPHCAMEFDKLTTYMGHIRIKHASDWVCPLCGYTFVSRKGVDVHKRKKHRLVDDNTPLEGPTCTVCDSVAVRGKIKPPNSCKKALYFEKNRAEKSAKIH